LEQRSLNQPFSPSSRDQPSVAIMADGERQDARFTSSDLDQARPSVTTTMNETAKNEADKKEAAIDMSQTQSPGEYMDINTGAPTTKYQSVMEVAVEDQEPRTSRWQNIFTLGSARNSEAMRKSVRPSDLAAGGEEATVKQYRIISTTSKKLPNSSFVKYFAQTPDAVSNFINNYMMWTFHASFTAVNIASFGVFMTFSLLFAAFIWFVKWKQPECIVTGEEDGEITFVDCFHLSWTTFSTVGYGIIAPGLSITTDGHRCIALNIMMAVEAFVGVLFAGVTGALVYAKVARVQSTAPIAFSDPIVVRFGDGCREQRDDDDDDDDDQNESAPINTGLPCPVLEFRILNTQWNEEDGEIINGVVNLVASRLEHPDDVDRQLCAINKENKEKNKKSSPTNKQGRGAPVRKSTPSKQVKLIGKARASSKNFLQQIHRNIISNAVDMHSSRSLATSNDSDASSSERDVSPINRDKADEEVNSQIIQEAVNSELDKLSAAISSHVVVVDEGYLQPKQVFSKLHVETDFHPFFKRTWIVRHVCNEHSPLLSPRIRKRILKNNGYWPEDLNNHDEVRKAINFYEIIVSFSGVANDSGSSVYTQRVYSYADMTIGYTFANMFTTEDTGKIIVDHALLNDVCPQASGGAEPIKTTDLPDFLGYSVEPDIVDPMLDPMLVPIVEDEGSQESDDLHGPGLPTVEDEASK